MRGKRDGAVEREGGYHDYLPSRLLCHNRVYAKWQDWKVQATGRRASALVQGVLMLTNLLALLVGPIALAVTLGLLYLLHQLGI